MNNANSTFSEWITELRAREGSRRISPEFADHCYDDGLDINETIEAWDLA